MGTASVNGIAGCGALSDSKFTAGTDECAEWYMPAYDRGFSVLNPDAAPPRNGVTERLTAEIPSPSARPVVGPARHWFRPWEDW